MNGSNEMGETARLWAIRVQDPAFDDWESFTAWLESDPEHLAHYEQALEVDAWARDLFATPHAPLGLVETPAVDAPRRRRWVWPAAFGLIAASLAVIASWTMLGRNGTQDIVTAPGEHRTIALSDGSRVALNGGTRISFDPDAPREIRLAQGEALFTVRHDAARPFTVIANGARLLDAGTVFNVVAQQGGAMRVAVAEGAVIYEPGPGQVRLNPGDTLSLTRPGARPTVSRTNPQAIGSWQQRQLLYDNATLDEVAQDLSRNIGRPIRVAGTAGAMRFTGTLMISDTPERTLERAAPLLGVTFEANGDAWTMTPAHVMSQ